MDHFAVRLASFDEVALRAHLSACGVEPGEVGASRIVESAAKPGGKYSGNARSFVRDRGQQPGLLRPSDDQEAT
jgi:hypothetical protein